ncbi:MAG: hypothetical protein GXP62_20775 [Oligoflexia bacterium]|nr:hypothetical protein [Oligoflexia bacterium]
MDQLEELKSWIGFTTAEATRLRHLRPAVAQALDPIADHFYAAIQRSPTARAVVHDDAQALRLHSSLQRWIMSLLTGPWDESWAQRSQHIGQIHVREGLPERYMFAAMSLVCDDLCSIADDTMDQADARDTCRAVHKVTELELCLMTGAYHAAHEGQQLRSLQQVIVENLPVHVLVLNDMGLVTSATHPKGRIFFENASPGQPYTAFLPPQLVVAADLDMNIRTALLTGKVQLLPNVPLPGPPTRHFRISIVPLQHELAHLLLHVEELTDVLDAQTRVHQAESLARIGAMAAQLAHEIRNPIAGISGTLQVIVNGMPTDDRRRPVLVRVQEQVHRLDRLVRDLLNYSKPAELSFRDTTLKALAEESIRQAGVKIELELVRDQPVHTDPDAVQQILVNLLQNAHEACSDGAWIGMRLGPGPEIWVMDAGPGVPREHKDDLFEPFVSTKTRGTGLGLAICKRRAQEIGASIYLHSGHMHWPEDRRRGAVFRLRLPPPVVVPD